MSIPSPESMEQARLRERAEARLKAGSAPPTRGWPTGVGTLQLLHELASTPESAVDALKLLHELQVHQVELDLQHEQIEITQRELAEDLARYQALYELAPLAYPPSAPRAKSWRAIWPPPACSGLRKSKCAGAVSTPSWRHKAGGR